MSVVVNLAVNPPAPPCSAPELIELSTRLAELLERETAELVAMNLGEARSFAEEKLRLTRRYRATLEELRAGRGSLKDAAVPIRTELMVVATRLAKAAAANERALRVGRATIERVVGAIADAVASHRRSVAGYGPHRPSAARLQVVGGVAVDRQL